MRTAMLGLEVMRFEIKMGGFVLVCLFFPPLSLLFGFLLFFVVVFFTIFLFFSLSGSLFP